MVFTGQHLVPYPVHSKKTFFAVNCNYFSFIHTRYDASGRRTRMATAIDGVSDFVEDYVYLCPCQLA